MIPYFVCEKHLLGLMKQMQHFCNFLIYLIQIVLVCFILLQFIALLSGFVLFSTTCRDVCRNLMDLLMKRRDTEGINQNSSFQSDFAILRFHQSESTCGLEVLTPFTRKHLYLCKTLRWSILTLIHKLGLLC